MRNFSHAVARVIASATAFFLANGCLAIATAADQPAAAAQTPPPRPVEIDKNSALILIRTALIALQQANQTGNYSVLYALSAPGFQKVNSPERLSQIFAKLRSRNLDISGIVVLEPQLTTMPEMYSNGILRMGGFFPSVPLQIFFDLQFAPVQGQWRLIAISVDVGAATPSAPTPNPALASSYTPAPAPTTAATAAPQSTPTPSPEASQATIEVRPAVKATASPRKKSSPSRQSLGRSSPIDH